MAKKDNSFDSLLSKLEKQWGNSVKAVEMILGKIERKYKRLQSKYHKELIEFYYEELIWMNSPLKFPADGTAKRYKNSDNLKMREFKDCINNLTDARRSKEQWNEVAGQLNRLKNLYNSMFHHFKANIENSRCILGSAKYKQ